MCSWIGSFVLHSIKRLFDIIENSIVSLCCFQGLWILQSIEIVTWPLQTDNYTVVKMQTDNNVLLLLVLWDVLLSINAGLRSGVSKLFAKK